VALLVQFQILTCVIHLFNSTEMDLYFLNFIIAANTAFDGCIFRAEFDNHWPIKKIFQAPRPGFVDVEPSFDSVREEKCGYEEILPDPEPPEIR